MQDDDRSEEQTLSVTDTAMLEEPLIPDIEVFEQTEIRNSDKGKRKPKAPKMDRSGHKYSEEAFLAMPRTEQFSLAETYWMDSKGFDESKMFQFSYTHFSDLCKQIGFKKGVVDTMPEQASSDLQAEGVSSVIYIDHGRRDSVEKKMTFAKETVNKIDQLLGDKLSNIERSKVIDVILSRALDAALLARSTGQFGVAYRPTEEERLL